MSIVSNRDASRTEVRVDELETRMNWQQTELRPSHGIRWAFGSAGGRRSSTYRLWANKKGDFYLSALWLGGSLKTSLHRDGRCHSGLTNEFASEIAVTQRHMDRWRVPLDRIVKAVQVVVAESDLAIYDSTEKDPMRWLQPPKAGHAATAGIILMPTADVPIGNSWPGADRGVQPIGVVETETRTAFVVHWENELTPEQAAQLHDLRNRVRATSLERKIAPAPGLRAVLIGQIGDDRTLFDVAYQDAT